MEKDVSKLTILILLVLTILVSVLGTWTVMSTITAPPVSRAEDSSTVNGHVSISIGEAPETPISEATGMVAIKIRPEE